MDVKNLVKYIRTGGNTYADALEYAVSLIHKTKRERGAKCDLDRKYVLFVPDKYTLLAEKLLYSDNSCSFDCEVLTINRLCYRLAEYAPGRENKPLSRAGAILTVRRIMNENPAALGAFARSARFTGFGEIMYENIAQLAACAVSPEELSGCGGETLKAKLAALGYVYSEFVKATQGKFVDASGRLKLAYELLSRGDCDYFRDTFVVFACYDGFTPLAARTVERVCALCGENNAHIIDAQVKLDIKNKEICEYEALSEADELKEAARRIRNLAYEGVSYDDMGVVAPSVDYVRLKRIFDEYGVPYFADQKYALSSHPLARYILDLFTAAHSPTNANYIRLAKNPYSGVGADEADEFENTVRVFAMKERSMLSEFDFAVNDARLAKKLERAEKVRAHLYGRVSAVRKSHIKSGADFVRAVERAMPADEEKISARYQANFPSAREEITAAVEVIGTVFAESDFDVLLDSLRECFALKEVGVIPSRSGAVEVGDASAFRASRKKYLFVLSMHDGELPAASKDEGFISDADIAALADKNVTVEPSIETVNERASEELDSVLTSCGNLFLSHIADRAPSQTLIAVRKAALACGAKVRAASLSAFRESLSPHSLVKMCPTRDAALELYLVGLDDIEAGGSGYGFEPELGEAVGGYLPARAKECDSVANGKELYLESGISVSRVQEYFACPFRHFMRYGLRARERADGSVSPLDLGTFLHRVIELFVAGGHYADTSCAGDAVHEIVGKIRAEEPELVRGMSEEFLAELECEAVKLSCVAAEQIASGAYVPLYTEASFGKSDSPLEGLEIVAADTVLTVDGVIDRMDVADAGEGSKGAARVVDYKTGRADFDLRDVYFGRKIQLPVYLKVAEKNGYIPSGMFYFPFSSGFVEDGKSYRLRGIFDAAYARETDAGLCEPEYESRVVAARSTKNSSEAMAVLYKRGSAVSRVALSNVCDYAERVLASGAEELISGYCAPSPLTGECDYCEMKAVCAARGIAKRERVKSAVKQSVFGAEEERE